MEGFTPNRRQLHKFIKITGGKAPSQEEQARRRSGGCDRDRDLCLPREETEKKEKNGWTN